MKKRDWYGNWSSGVENGHGEILEEGWRLDGGKRLMDTHDFLWKMKGNVHTVDPHMQT